MNSISRFLSSLLQHAICWCFHSASYLLDSSHYYCCLLIASSFGHSALLCPKLHVYGARQSNSQDVIRNSTRNPRGFYCDCLERCCARDIQSSSTMLLPLISFSYQRSLYGSAHQPYTTVCVPVLHACIAVCAAFGIRLKLQANQDVAACKVQCSHESS